jgi:beta-lactam-binding protein with PASTA domain
MKEYLKFLISKQFLKHLGLAVALIIGVFFLWIFMLQFYTHHGIAITVPDFRGKTVDEILKVLEDKNLKYKVRDTVYYDDKRKGCILEQDPQPESHVKEGRVIYFTINGLTPPNVKFPDNIEGSLRNAKTQLENRGLNVNAIYVDGPHQDYVVSASFDGHDVKAGDLIPKGSTIDLTVMKGFGGNSIEIPDFIGKTMDEVLQIIKEQNLSIPVFKPEHLKNDPNAIVEKQVPEADTTGNAKMNQNDPIYIYLKLKD